MNIHFILIFAIFLIGCSSSEETEQEKMRRLNQKGEYLYRRHEDAQFIPPPPLAQAAKPYPWEAGISASFPKITKEFFRCKGCSLNPVRLVQNKGEEAARYHDCGGSTRHSLPLRNNKEYIYPVLIDILNDLQLKLGKKVVITSGHRCPEHNAYVDSGGKNRSSKHMIGAEVSFYVQGLENRPETVVKQIMSYYAQNSKYKGKKDFTEFKRYEKGDTDVATQPWFNKEIFIKLFQRKEGRDFDNRHPYPYLSIQVRYDMETQQPVTFSWEQASRQYLRW